MIALGATPAASLVLAVEVEALARPYLQALALGEPPVLSDDEMERVIARRRRMRYGQALDDSDDGPDCGPERDGIAPLRASA